jgi:ASC-1-like (ASCH) protein
MQTKYDLYLAEEKLHDVLAGMKRIESTVIA